MDQFTNDWLISIGLSNLAVRFKEEEIDKVALLGLTEIMICELIPKIGQRSKFSQHLKQLLINEKVNTSEDITNVDDINSMEMILLDSSSHILNNIVEDEEPNASGLLNHIDIGNEGLYVKELLEKFQDGLMIMKFYDTNKFLNASMRNQLSTVLIKAELHKQTDTNKLDKPTFCKLSKGIEQLFHSETQYSYFIPYKKEGSKISPNRGKLYDKYCNIKKEIHKITPVIKRKNIEDHVVDLNNDEDADDDINDALCWLQNNSEPDTTLFELWNKTRQYRLTGQNKNNGIYPGLKKPTGYLLIDIDFKFLHPNKDMCLLQKFDIFKVQLQKYLTSRNVSLGVKQHEIVTTFLNTNESDLGRDFAAIQLIPFLMKPVIFKLKTKSFKPSIVEQASAVITNITNVNDLNNIKSQKVEKAFSLGLTVQPYIVIVDNTISYTVVNDLLFKLETPIKALDICFKAFHTLNLEYPKEAEQVWHFISEYFFGITDFKHKFIGVKSLVNDLSKQ